MKKIHPSDYLVTDPIKLKDFDTKAGLDASHKKLKKKLRKTSKKIADFQDRMYAQGKYAALICIQGMDTAGKDSLIREVFKGLNARGVVVHSFKTPSKEELKHDFLWRHAIALPERGKIGVFNRTHYENVLVTRVHPEYVLNENIPGIDKVEDLNAAFWDQRFQQIRNFEDRLTENGILLFKFFLNISKEEQRYRLLRRLRKEDKNWKFSAGDLKERKLWDEYQGFYEEAINRSATSEAPWHIIPSDDKKEARYVLAEIIQQKFDEYETVQPPELDEETASNIEKYKKQLEAEQ